MNYRLAALARKLRASPTKPFALIPILFREGPIGVTRKLKQIFFLTDINQQYQVWLAKHKLTKQAKQRQIKESKQFTYRPTISIVVPTYNTPLPFLKDCIESVIDQTYDNWELCIADDASTSPKVAQALQDYSKRDNRIKVIIRKKNGHISEASNTALSLATGEFVGLLDHDDILWPNALYEVAKALQKDKKIDFLYSDHDKLEDDGKSHTGPFFKPDWSPDYLRSINYITHFAVIRTSLIHKVGGFRKGYEGAQDWDLFLRVTENTNRIHHIQTILYSWRKTPESTASEKTAGKVKTYAYVSQKKALESDLRARRLRGKVIETDFPGEWRVRYDIIGNPVVSIVIPTKNQLPVLTKCVTSVLDKTSYPNYEIVLVDTGSTDKEVLAYYKKNQKKYPQMRVLNWEGKRFNFSSACNFGADKAKGKYLVFLNNDTEVITPDWLEGMLEHAQRKDVGCVGAKLLYPNKLIQHLGGIVGIPGDSATEIGRAGHAFRGQRSKFLHHDREAVKNYSFVTAACLMIAKKKFIEAGQFDERFFIAFNDVDFGLRISQKYHYFNVLNPFVVLYHHESISVKKPGSKQRDEGEWLKELQLFVKTWQKIRLHDPFYNPNLSLQTECFDRLNLQS